MISGRSTRKPEFLGQHHLCKFSPGLTYNIRQVNDDKIILNSSHLNDSIWLWKVLILCTFESLDKYQSRNAVCFNITPHLEAIQQLSNRCIAEAVWVVLSLAAFRQQLVVKLITITDANIVFIQSLIYIFSFLDEDMIQFPCCILFYHQLPEEPL